MLVSKMSVLKPLIESKKGQHLSAYFPNGENLFQLRQQLRDTLTVAYDYLTPAMKPEALERFVAPIHKAIEDTRLLKNLKDNIAIFRNESSFRILSIPVPVEHSCIVATSFHVKPLLRWMQVDRDFLLLGINEGSASLYQGNQNTFSLIDTIIFPDIFQTTADGGSYQDWKRRRLKSLKYDEIIEWMNDWLLSLTKESKPPLFVAGQKEVTDPFFKGCRYENTRRQEVSTTFTQEKALEIGIRVRSLVKKDIRQSFEQTLMEFYQAENLNLANKNIFQIAKAAIKGKVKKLIITDGVNIFGKIDKNTGGLAIHPRHLDHEDDDILDDLAQEVLAQGGEVVVASRDEIPKGTIILAIFERPDFEITKQTSIYPIVPFFGPPNYEKKPITSNKSLKGDTNDSHYF